MRSKFVLGQMEHLEPGNGTTCYPFEMARTTWMSKVVLGQMGPGNGGGNRPCQGHPGIYFQSYRDLAGLKFKTNLFVPNRKYDDVDKFNNMKFVHIIGFPIWDKEVCLESHANKVL